MLKLRVPEDQKSRGNVYAKMFRVGQKEWKVQQVSIQCEGNVITAAGNKDCRTLIIEDAENNPVPDWRN